MNILIQSSGDVRIVYLKASKLSFPLLADFSKEITSIIEAGSRKLIINLADVSYLDSASFGCLMDIHRLISAQGGKVKLVGLQERVADMARLTGVSKTIEVYPDDQGAVDSLWLTGDRSRAK